MARPLRSKRAATAAAAAGILCIGSGALRAEGFSSLKQAQRPAHRIHSAEQSQSARTQNTGRSWLPVLTGCEQGYAHWALASSLSIGAGAVLTGLTQKKSPKQRCGHAHRAHVVMSQAANKGAVETFIIQGDVDVAQLSMKCAGIAGYMDLSTIVFFSLGVSEQTIASAAGGALGLHGACPVFMVDCYGIVGYDEKEGKNIELMEEGRGKEYGGIGGKGGKGVVVVAFRGPAYKATIDQPQVTEAGESHMLVCNGGAAYEPAKEGAVYGGMAKKCFVMDSNTGRVREISSFAVSGAVTSAVSTFAGDAAAAAKVAVASMPQEAKEVKSAGYFPCYMRGINKYGTDGVECAEFAENGMDNIRLFGMFAHGELGPPEGSVLVGGADVGGSIEQTPLSKHSMVSILALLQDS